MSSYSLDAITDNCYPNTTILINKLDIKNEPDLLKAEIKLTQAASILWEMSGV